MSQQTMQFQMGEDGLPVQARIEILETEWPFTEAAILIPADVEKLKQEMRDKIQGMKLMGMPVPDEINDDLIERFFEDQLDSADEGCPIKLCLN